MMPSENSPTDEEAAGKQNSSEAVIWPSDATKSADVTKVTRVEETTVVKNGTPASNETSADSSRPESRISDENTENRAPSRNRSQQQSPRDAELDDMSTRFVTQAAQRKLSQDFDRHSNADDNNQKNFRSSPSDNNDADRVSPNQQAVKQHGDTYERENSGNQTPLYDSNQFFASAAQRRYSNDFDQHVTANDSNQKSFTNAYSPREVRDTETRRRLSVSDSGNGGGGGDVDQAACSGGGAGRQFEQSRYVQQLSKKSEEPSDYEHSSLTGPHSTDGSEYEGNSQFQQQRSQSQHKSNKYSSQQYGQQQQWDQDNYYDKSLQRPHSPLSRRSRDRDEIGTARSDYTRSASWFGDRKLQDQNLGELIFTALKLLSLLTFLFISLKVAGAIGRYTWHAYHHPPTISRLQRGIQVEKGEYCRSFDSIPNYGFPIAMEEMLHDARWSDVIVEADDGTQKKAHKVVLAARSPVLRAELEALSKRTDDDGRISCSADKPCELRLSKIEHGAVLTSFIEFLYTSRTSDRKHAAELLGLGHAFQVPDLKDAAAEDLMLDMSSNDDSIHALIAGHDHEHGGLRNYSMEYIRENWKRVRESNAWKDAVEKRPALIIDALMYVITESKCRF